MRKRISRSPSLFLSHSLSHPRNPVPRVWPQEKNKFSDLIHAKISVFTWPNSILPYKNFKPIFVKNQFKCVRGVLFLNPDLFSGQKVFVRTWYKQRWGETRLLVINRKSNLCIFLEPTWCTFVLSVNSNRLLLKVDAVPPAKHWLIFATNTTVILLLWKGFVL